MSLLVAESSPIRRSEIINRSLDNTALAAYMRCPKIFEYGYLRHRRGRGLSSPAIMYGSVWHKLLEAHYRTGDRTAAIRAAVMAWEPHSKPEDHRTIDRLLLEYDNYVSRYGMPEDEAKNWGSTVGYPGEAPLVEISTELAWPEALHPYAGKIDRIVLWEGLYIVEDHKTSGQMGGNFFQQFDPSNQMMGYAWLAQLLTGLPIAGVRINAHGILKSQGKFEKQLVSYSQDRLQDWGRNFNYWVKRIERDIEEGVFGHNFDACAGKYGMCQYTSVCTMSPQYRIKVLEKDYDYDEWDPMSPEETEDL